MPNVDQNAVQQILNSQVSKSEKIRQLNALGGLSQYRIAKLMDVIPQFVNNVLKKEATKKSK